ncbi:MAG: tetratricopeptide repeat protein [Treponema sp.]|nr:tetratricopeptide repeat protein [Treponema sp.]
MQTVDLSNPYKAKMEAERLGVPVESLYNMDIKLKTQLIEKNPDNPRLYLERGNDYYETQNYGAAIKDYKRVEELQPNNPTVYHYLGDCFDQIGQIEKAIEYFTKAINFSDYEGLDSVYEHRAILFMNQEEFNKALNDINKAIELRPEGVSEYYHYRSMIYYALKDIENAQKDYEHWRDLKISSFKNLLSSWSYKDKEQMLFNLFTSLNNEDQLNFLSQSLVDFGPNSLVHP